MPAPPKAGLSFQLHYPLPSRTSKLLESSTLQSQIFILLPQGPYHSPQFHSFFFLKVSPTISPLNLRGF